MRRPTFAVVALGVLLSGMGWLTVGTASAATKAERERAAAELVTEALFGEIYGKDSQRAELLASALEQVPDSAAALWQSGHVRHNRQWVKFDELPELAAEDLRLTAYRRARGQHPPTLQGRLALAQWCAKRKLTDQQRAHLTEALEVNPEHRQARRLLGYRLVDGVWLGEKEILQSEIRGRQAAAGLQQWKPQLVEIREDLEHRAQQKREKARERLREIDDPAAVPAIELVFCAADEQTALLGVETLGQIVGHEAAVALARQAVFSPWPKVREAAAERLKTRDKHDYVPALLSVLRSPLQSRAALYQAPGGRLVYRHALYREGTDRPEIGIFDATYHPFRLNDPRLIKARGPGEARNHDRLMAQAEQRKALQAVQRQAAMQAQAREAVVARQNAFTQELNGRVCWVLSTGTGAIVRATADSWWQWWDDYNEVFVPDYRPPKVVYQEVAYDVSVGLNRRYEVPAAAAKYSCLAAGTPVWTESGPIAIEKIQVGDRVLSQHIQTGELAYKPVLRTTVRPPVQLMKFDAGGETIVCTGGHPFWICGDGWVMARRLAPGTRLHRVTGTAGVASLGEAHKGPAYNLVVGDFHTYFVGAARILSHDNTIRRPANALVPGLAKR